MPRKPTKTRNIKKGAFLAAFSQCGIISRAAELAKIDRSCHYEWIKNPDYKKQFEEAEIKVANLLEDEAIRRAKEGWDEPVFYAGQQCGVIRKYSDTLLIFILKGLKPEKYRERYDHEHSGNITHNIKIIDYTSIGKMKKEE